MSMYALSSDSKVRVIASSHQYVHYIHVSMSQWIRADLLSQFRGRIVRPVEEHRKDLNPQPPDQRAKSLAFELSMLVSWSLLGGDN